VFLDLDASHDSADRAEQSHVSPRVTNGGKLQKLRLFLLLMLLFFPQHRRRKQKHMLIGFSSHDTRMVIFPYFLVYKKSVDNPNTSLFVQNRFRRFHWS